MDLEARLALAEDVASAAEAVVAYLASIGPYMPSLYLERGGRLRYQALRGYWQVLDGFPPDAGVIGRTWQTGRPTLLRSARHSPDFLEAVPGVVDEVCVPLRYRGAVVGALNAEGPQRLPDDATSVLEGCAERFESHLDRLGGPPPESSGQRLARHLIGLAGKADAGEVLAAAVDAACDVTGMGSAMAALHGADCSGDSHRSVGSDRPGPEAVEDERALIVRRTTGPLAGALSAIGPEGLSTIAGWVRPGTSCYSLGNPDGEGFVGQDAIRAAGAASVIVVALAAAGAHLGLLLTADSTASHPPTSVVERLELLAAQAATSLRAARVLGELRTRASCDPLTGLGHHSAYQAAIGELRGRLPRGRQPAVVLADVDGFKAVNDRLGHLAGDRLLQDLAEALSDGLPEGERLFRIGGDEFATVVAVADDEEAYAVGRALHRSVRASGLGTVSIGVAVVERDESDHDAFARADAALYAVKAAGATVSGSLPVGPSGRISGWCSVRRRPTSRRDPLVHRRPAHRPHQHHRLLRPALRRCR